MEQVQAASRRLAEQTGRRLVDLWALVEVGALTVEMFRTLGSSLVVQANVTAVSLASLGLSAEASRQLRQAIPPPLLLPTPTQVDADRVARDIDRILEHPPADATTPELVSESRHAQFERLARSEPLITVATTVGTGMTEMGAAGWTRQLAGQSCPFCVSLADGVVRPPTVSMRRHIGCDCIQAPVFT